MPFPVRSAQAAIAAVVLAVGGCATQEDIRSVTYEYTAQDRLAAERRATQDMQDSCYFSGTQYAEPEGPPQIVREQGPGGGRFRVTQAFYCVGTQGGP